jgi:hypothetical protein
MAYEWARLADEQDRATDLSEGAAPAQQHQQIQPDEG